MNFRFTLGALLATTTAVCAYLGTALYARDVSPQHVAMIATPMIVLIAVIAWVEPGRLSRAAVGLFRGVAHIVRRAMRGITPRADDDRRSSLYTDDN